MTVFAPLILVYYVDRVNVETGWEIPSEACSWVDISPNLNRNSEYDLINFKCYSKLKAGPLW